MWGFQLLFCVRSFVLPLHWLPFRLRFIVVNPGLVSGDMSRKSSPKDSYHSKRSAHACSLCSLWSPVSMCGTHLAHSFLKPSFFRIVSRAARYCLVVMRQSWRISWFTFSLFSSVTVVQGQPNLDMSFKPLPASHTPNPTPHSADIDCLFPIEVLQTLMKFNGCSVFSIQELDHASLLQTHVNVTLHFDTLLHLCYLDGELWNLQCMDGKV
jgi:hypothetical protein